LLGTSVEKQKSGVAWSRHEQTCILQLTSDFKGGHMETELEPVGKLETRSSTAKQLILFATVASGCIAAYLMYRRGESLGTIARQAITNPFGSLVSEVKHRI
jgi:hypothetical protein